ncbi:UNKNOWN [Stylonychia lemnae]|uniref:Uncharacterized protein n=1 Tax=Stylonychia lemnae TaxID=5949 RepID=A0A078B211_STYLE|nr:UNKNOWN [Stylonychia lemnae]|eukprot:CDW87322.1 UNKNOWN [Stylonychia lemnae]
MAFSQLGSITTEKFCKELDELIVSKFNEEKYMKKNESFINIFDKQYQTTFKMRDYQGKELDDFFPKYKNERKNILVKLRQDGEMTNILYEIFENKQEQSLKLLIKISKANYQLHDEIMKVLSDTKIVNKNTIELIKNIAKDQLNDLEIIEIIENAKLIVNNRNSKISGDVGAKESLSAQVKV